MPEWSNIFICQTNILPKQHCLEQTTQIYLWSFTTVAMSDLHHGLINSFSVLYQRVVTRQRGQRLHPIIVCCCWEWGHRSGRPDKQWLPGRWLRACRTHHNSQNPPPKKTTPTPSSDTSFFLCRGHEDSQTPDHQSLIMSVRPQSGYICVDWSWHEVDW